MVGYGISLAEAAKRLQVDQATVLSALQSGALPVQMMNGRPVVSQAALLDYQVRKQRSQAWR
jgi:predicted DNA-binding protein (UPF0251 family)